MSFDRSTSTSTRPRRSVTVGLRTLALYAPFIAFGVGCAAAMPPRELVDARAAYAHAQGGDAPRLKPVDLHLAKEALDRAEATFADKGESQETTDLSYVAWRRAQIADASGTTAAWMKSRPTRHIRSM